MSRWRRFRRAFWHAATAVCLAGVKFCGSRRARLCPCPSCYVLLNRDRIMADIMRELAGEKPVDRRPS